VWVWRRSMVAASHAREGAGDEKMSMDLPGAGSEQAKANPPRQAASPARSPLREAARRHDRRAKAALP
jgi:hypothetical protein